MSISWKFRGACFSNFAGVILGICQLFYFSLFRYSALLSIKSDQDLGDDVWKDIARAIGYTSFEIDMKFKDEVDPLKKLLDDYKKRGGSSNDFITAMYRIGRKEYVSIYERRLKNALPEGERILEDDMVGQNG